VREKQKTTTNQSPPHNTSVGIVLKGHQSQLHPFPPFPSPISILFPSSLLPIFLVRTTVIIKWVIVVKLDTGGSSVAARPTAPPTDRCPRKADLPDRRKPTSAQKLSPGPGPEQCPSQDSDSKHLPRARARLNTQSQPRARPLIKPPCPESGPGSTHEPTPELEPVTKPRRQTQKTHTQSQTQPNTAETNPNPTQTQTFNQTQT